jgi:hypothetical protein
MQYRVACECGDYVTVPETDAGTAVPCRCGRRLAIPSLRELRRLADLPEPAVSPEMAVEHLLLAGKLPDGDRCVLCSVRTDSSVCCTVECERAYIRSGRPPPWVTLVGFAFGWLGLLFILAKESGGQDREVGKDRIFSLPLRVCDRCRPGLTEPAELKAALNRVPLYRSLLDKYPKATLFLPCQPP